MVEKELGPGRIQFAVHSQNPDDPHDREVDGAVFAAKLGALVRALKAADKAVNNGSHAHHYTIAKLHSSTPTAVLVERPFRPHHAAASGIEGFNACAAAIAVGATEQAMRFGSCAQSIALLSAGAERLFGYAEVATADNLIRVDPFLRERAQAVVSPAHGLQKATSTQEWFKGATQGSFVGSVQVADLRGKLPAIKLILSAGGRAIDCICTGVGVEEIRSALSRRVRLSGRALYDGKSGLPRRVEVRTIEHIDEADGFERWSGAFEPFTPPDFTPPDYTPPDRGEPGP